MQSNYTERRNNSRGFLKSNQKRPVYGFNQQKNYFGLQNIPLIPPPTYDPPIPPNQKPIPKVEASQSFKFLKNKGNIKIKLGALYTLVDELPDDFDCLKEQIESIFVCLSESYKPPYNRGQKKCGGYTVFYFDRNEQILPMRDDLEFRTFMKQKNECNHPIYGIRIFVVPHAGEEFLNANSLSGDREVKLDEQTWKLLFTQNNHIMKLRYEKVMEPEEVKVEEKKEPDERLEEMKKFLLQSILQSRQVDDDEIDDEGNSVYISPFYHQNHRLEESREVVPPPSDVIQSSVFVHIDSGEVKDEIREDQKQIKADAAPEQPPEKADPKQAPAEPEKPEQKPQAEISEKDDQEANQQSLQPEEKKEKIEYVGGMEITNEDEDKFEIEKVVSEEQVCSEKAESSEESDSSSELDEEEEKQLRQVIQNEIDQIVTDLFSEEMQRRKDLEREKKFDELFFQKLGSEVEQILVDESVPEDEEDGSYINQRAQRVSIAFVKNPYENDEKEIVPVDMSEEVKENKEEVKDNSQIPEIPYVPAPKTFEEVPSFDKKDTRKETVPLIVQPVVGNQNPKGAVFQPIVPQGYQNPYPQIDEGVPLGHQDLPSSELILQGAEGGAVKPGGVVVPSQQKHHEQLKERIKNEEKKDGVINQVKLGMKSVIQFFKDTAKIRKNSNYKWGPIEMAAIVKEVRGKGNIINQEKQRLSDEAVCPPKRQYQMEVKVVNLSQYIWPKEVWIDLVKANKKIKFTPYKIQLKLAPGQQGIIKIGLITPKQPGKYHCMFGLRGVFEKKQQMYFGELIDLNLWVREPTLDDMNTRLYQNAEKLHQEGLGEFEECVRVLKVHRMNYEKAREELYLRIYRMR